MSTNNSTNEINPPVKRKRGRPRKNPIVVKEKKKRGRKPKLTKTESTNKENIKENKEEDEIIIHIPFKIEDINNEVVASIEKKKTNSSSPPDTQNTNIFTIADISDDSYSDEYLCNGESNELIKKLKQKDEIIKKLEDVIKEHKKIINESIMHGINEKKVQKMNVDLINIENGKEIVIDSTDIACWWCTEQFDTIPCFIPEKVDNGKYHVFGCFCSYNCAAAYNMDMNDYKTWDRYSILQKLYREIFGDNNELAAAPPRQCLSKFGGNLTIDEFRNSSIKNEKEYRFIMPPMVSIVPYIEESCRDVQKWEKLRSSDGENNLILKRSKPLPNSKNTLFETMGLVVKEIK